MWHLDRIIRRAASLLLLITLALPWAAVAPARAANILHVTTCSGNAGTAGSLPAQVAAAGAGDIVVFGSIRGVVHAGVMGDTGAIIAALSMTPTQLRIGTIYGRPAEPGADDAGEGPCIAHLDGGELVVVPWYGGRDVPPLR